MKNSIRDIVNLIRLHHYVKNLFIFAPLFFSGGFFTTEIVEVFLAFLAFSISASAVYIFNDYHDIESDRKHPKKRKRPLASGSVSRKTAIILMLVFLIVGLSLMLSLSLRAFEIQCAYIILNIAYTLRLKHVAIVDIVIIAIGFVLRLYVGSSVAEVSLSIWIITMTFLLSLFMALAKRRDDLLISLTTDKKIRKVIDGYNMKFIDHSMMIMASVVIVTYVLYTSSNDIAWPKGNEYLFLTTLFIILGILRYLQISLVEKGGGSPTRIIIKDRFIQVTVLSWVVVFFWIIYT